MKQERQIFHESWYRIANQRICLRATVKVRRQLFRGTRWYILYDPFSNQFFRLRPAAYEFVARLSNTRTVEEVWREVMECNPQDAPGQEEVIHLLAQLYHANLLHYQLPPDTTKLFERYKQRKQRILQANLLNIMFLRIPLWDPDNFLKRLLPFIRVIMSPIGTIFWSGIVIFAVKEVIDHFSEFRVQSQGILAPSNLFLLYLGAVIVKTLHEFGHAFAVRRFGGEVHTMGIMFLIFTPFPYMDATAAWTFRSKWKRVFVGIAGMVVEIFVAACCVFIWANTGPGVIHSLAYNIIFIASVSTLLFNLNPLMRFDGYYILSDLLDIPNLRSKAMQQLVHLVEYYAFGYKKSQSPAFSKKEAFWLTFYGLMSGVYTVVVFSRILLFVADKFLLAGIIMAIICAVSWVVVPLVRLGRYLATSPKLERIRLRAVLVSVGVLGGCISFLYFYPFPHNFKAPGVLKASDSMVVVSKTDGYVAEIVTPSGRRVEPGDPLVRLENKEIEFKIAEVQAELEEITVQRQQAIGSNQGDLKPIESQLIFLKKRLAHLQEEKNNLLLRAEIGGIWVAPKVEEYLGKWVLRGTPLGELVNDEKFYFSCVILQQEASRLFCGKIKSLEVRLAGQSKITLPVSHYITIPAEHNILPSPALGWAGGGEIAVDLKDSRGVTTVEPFYEVKAEITPVEKIVLFHRSSGRIKFRLEEEPLLRQWWYKLRQLLQKRYQL